MDDTSKIIVYVGDVSEYLAVEAKSYDPNASLITSKDFGNLIPGTYYTSLGDLEHPNQLAEIFYHADVLHYRPPKTWSDQLFGISQMRKQTEELLEIFSQDPKKIVTGVSINDPTPISMLELVDQRKTTQQQLWVAGCSISQGQGVDEDQRYGKIIASRLNLPMSLLAESGSSIPWAADQLMRSDIRAGDTILWGLTSPYRLTYWNDLDEKLSHCSLLMFETDTYLHNLINKKFLTSDQMVYRSLISIEQVSRFCDLKQARLIMFTVIPGLEPYLFRYKNFMPLTGKHLRHDLGDRPNNMYPDLGADNYHPGPLTHELYANRLLERFFPDQKRSIL